MAYKIFISPSDQNRNVYAVGNTTEDVQCGKIGAALEKALKRCGFDTKLMQYYTMYERVTEANTWGADLYIPVHTNAFDGSVSGTRMFASSTTSAGWIACEKIFKYLAPLTPGTSDKISTYPELYEIKYPSAPTAYIEVDFHDNKTAAQWIIDHTEDIAEAICHGVCDHFSVKYVAPEIEPEEPINIGDGSDWSKADREWAIRNGIFEGDEFGDFHWKAPITREETAAVLHRLSGR